MYKFWNEEFVTKVFFSKEIQKLLTYCVVTYHYSSIAIRPAGWCSKPDDETRIEE